MNSTEVFVFPVLMNKRRASRVCQNVCRQIPTDALKGDPSSSIEYNPGLRCRSCACPIVIIDVPSGARFTEISEGLIRTKADADADEALIVAVNVN